jgi:hypothetical protein
VKFYFFFIALFIWYRIVTDLFLFLRWKCWTYSTDHIEIEVLIGDATKIALMSLYLEGYTWTECQFYVAQILLHFSPTISCPFIAYPYLGSIAFSSNSWRWYSCPASYQNITQDTGVLHVTLISIHANSISTSFQMFAVQPTPLFP